MYTYGDGDFSMTGQGGSKIISQPTLLKTLQNQRVVKVACGEYHTLALTDRYDLYSWGWGFEGQLGLSPKIQIASTPKFVKDFFGKQVTYISCGAYYSLAITNEKKLYGWGEARMG